MKKRIAATGSRNPPERRLTTFGKTVKREERNHSDGTSRVRPTLTEMSTAVETPQSMLQPVLQGDKVATTRAQAIERQHIGPLNDRPCLQAHHFSRDTGMKCETLS